MLERLALLLTDVVDSTTTNSLLGDAAMARLWQAHDEDARELIRVHGGREIGRTDGFLVAFRHMDDALAFSLAYHRALDALAQPWKARVGIHVGEVVLRRNSPEAVAAGATVYDIDGLAVPVAARICALARGRQTLLSDAAREALTVTAVRVVSHGHWRLKGVAEHVELFEAGDERCDFLPPDDGEKGYRVVAVGDHWQPLREIRHTVPSERDPFVGRRVELLRLAELLRSGVRLASVVGAGGMGKTRTAVHFAQHWLGEFSGGAWFCDLSEARDVLGICSAMAQGLDLTLGRADPRRRLGEAIAGRGHCLVILDNVEQVASLAAELLNQWLDRAPQARFIATTRERLGLPGEHVVAMDPMQPREAKSLFLRRAHAHNPKLRLQDADDRAVERLVELLDGLPLAIELAAGRLSLMSVGDMLARIDQRFTLLAGHGGRPRRQSTLRAAFDWSWELLKPVEQHALAQASVFAGGFTLDAAEGVLQVDRGDAATSVLEVLASLVDKSFLRVEEGRFSLLVSVRDYAAGKLQELSRHDAELWPETVESRHGTWFASLGRDAAGRSGVELENLMVAARRAIARADVGPMVRLCEAAWQILEGRGPISSAAELVEAALAVPGLSPAARVGLQHIRGRCALVSGDAVGARDLLSRAHAGATALGLVLDELRALSSLAELNLNEGRVDEARNQYESAVAGAERAGDVPLLCAALNGLGAYFDHLGEFEQARSRFQRALEVAQGAGDQRWEGGALSNLGQVEANLGRRVEAKSHYDRAVEVARQLGDRVWEGNLLCNLGLFTLQSGQTREARAHLDRSLALAREGGLSLLESVVRCNIGLLSESVGDLAAAEEAYREALASARQRGDLRSQGQFQAYLGLVVALRGDAEQGRDVLRGGISLLRQVQDRLSLAIAQCRYAQGSVLWGDPAGGQPALDEAAAIAADIAVADGSELAQSLAAARVSLSTGRAATAVQASTVG